MFVYFSMVLSLFQALQGANTVPVSQCWSDLVFHDTPALKRVLERGRKGWGGGEG